MTAPQTQPPTRSRATFLKRTIACAFLLVAPHASAQHAPTPWEELERAPRDIELAIVMDDPASMLLSEEIAMSRGAIGAFGIMPNTRRAWRSLSDTLGMTSDEAIRTLLSGRVALLMDWDRGAKNDASARLPSMLAHIDTHWVLSAQIPPETLDTLSRRLKPIPRDIVDGVLVYAIEQGRFSLAIIAPDQPGSQARLLVAPKGASRTLSLALESARTPSNLADQPCAPIASDTEASCIAVRSRPELFSTQDAALRFSSGSYVWAKLSAPTPDHGRAEIAITPDPAQLDALRIGGAPIHLLGIADSDTLLACATNPILGLDLSDALGIRVSLDPASNPSPFTPRGALLLVSDPDDPDARDNTNVSTILSRCEPGSVDRRVLDTAFARAIGDDAPDFGGRFPGATRTHGYTTDAGQTAAVSWRVLDLGASSDVIVSFAPTQRAASAAVERLAERVTLVETLGVEPLSGSTIAKGTLDVARIFDLVSEPGRAIAPFPVSEISGDLNWSITLDHGILRAVIETTPGRGARSPDRAPKLGTD